MRACAGVGVKNHVELRLADSVLEVILNGVRLSTVIDARYGFGSVGWRTSSYGNSSRVVLHSLEIRRVTTG